MNQDQQFPIGFLTREQIRGLLNVNIAGTDIAEDDPRLTDAMCAKFAIGFGEVVQESADEYDEDEFIENFIADNGLDDQG